MNEEPSNTSDLAKHCRLIHFALLATCATLLAAGALPRGSSIERAVDDVANIKKIVSSWPSIDWHNYLVGIVDSNSPGGLMDTPLWDCAGWLPVDLESDQAPKTLAGFRSHWESLHKMREITVVRQKHDHAFCNPMWLDFVFFEERENVEIHGIEMLPFPRPDKKWDGASHYAFFSGCLFIPLMGDEWRDESIPESIKTGLIYSNKDMDSSIPDTPIILAYLRGGWISTELIKFRFRSIGPEVPDSVQLPVGFNHWVAGELRGDRWRCDLSDEPCVYLPAFCTKLESNSQAYFLAKLDVLHGDDEKNWRYGPFAKSFPELDSESVHIQSAKLSDLEDHLLARRQRSGEGIQVLGLKLPRSAIELWGLVALIGVQLYLWLHLRILASRINRHDQAWETPWLALYHDSRIARTIFALTLFLPIATCVQIRWDVSDSDTIFWFSLAAFGCGSGIFSVFAIVDCLALWRKAPSATAGDSMDPDAPKRPSRDDLPSEV